MRVTVFTKTFPSPFFPWCKKTEDVPSRASTASGHDFSGLRAVFFLAFGLDQALCISSPSGSSATEPRISKQLSARIHTRTLICLRAMLLLVFGFTCYGAMRIHAVKHTHTFAHPHVPSGSSVVVPSGHVTPGLEASVPFLAFRQACYLCFRVNVTFELGISSL